MENPELYEYLKKNFYKVNLLDNGVYYAVDNYGVEMYVPSNIDSSADLLAYYPGMGGSTNDASQVRKTMKSDNPPSYVAVISPTSYDSCHILDKATSVLNDNNIDVSGVVTVTFSASGGTGFKSLEAYLEKHEELADKSAMIIADGYNISDVNASKMTMLIDNQVPIFHIGPHDGNRVTNIDTNLAKDGYNIYRIDTWDNVHMYINRDIFANQMPEYVLGYVDEVGNNGTGGKEPNYIVYKYNKETSEYEEVNIDAMQLNMVLTADKIKVINVKDLFRVDDFEIKEYPVECLSKYEALKNIETGLSINFGTLSDTVLSSDMIYVTSAMSSLRTQIKNSNFLNGKTLGFRSSTGIPGCITGYINAYYDIMGQLMDSLVRQTESVMSVGQAIVDMNIAMEKKAEELGEAPGVIEEVGAPPTLISEEEEKEEEPPVKETPNTPPIVNPPKEDPVVPPVKETPNTPPIIPPIKEEPEPVSPPVKETPEPEPTEEPVPTKEPEVTQEPTPSEEEAILPELVVGEREDGSKILIEMREGKVTEVKYTYEYGSIEEAESALESIKEKYKELEYIKEIKVNNTNIDIIFKEESYIDLDMDSILNKYFN